MKSIKKIFAFVILIMFFVPITHLMAQGPPPPPGGSGGGVDKPVGGGASIGGGCLILLGVAMAYGGIKLYKFSKEEVVELD